MLQALYDQRGPASGRPPFRIVLCGSAISLMSSLLAGSQALRGRAVIDMRIGPFPYRDAARFWNTGAEVGFLVDAVLGGAPGYRDLVGEAPAVNDGEALFRWLERTVLNPSHILFSEPDYLLSEDPNISDRSPYHAIWQAVSAGASTPTKIGALVGVPARSLHYHMTIMREAGFLRHDQDLLLQRRPVITVADPIVRFHNLIVRPNLAEFELRTGADAWKREQETFTSKVLGPHFEELAREWARRHAQERGLRVGQVGTTVVACREHRGHDVDVVALDPHAFPRNKNGRIVLLGEAKATTQRRGPADIRRLEHIRDLLTMQGRQAEDAHLAVFSLSGFDPSLSRDVDPARVHLLDLAGLYGI